MTISVSHVRIHQEFKKVKSALSHVEILNIMADNLTKAARNFKSKKSNTSLPQNPIDFSTFPSRSSGELRDFQFLWISTCL
jgi:hypothetical protein